jgi:pyrroloquinoline quinone biosynthesis protein B
MLERAPNQVTWTSLTPGAIFELLYPLNNDPAGNRAGLHCKSIPLGTHYPAYVSNSWWSEHKADDASLGLIIESASGKRLACLPAVPRITDALLQELERADVVLFDGTFWSDDELIRTQGGGQTARQMGHVPVSSPEGSLAKLAQISRPRKIYLHINNTNPMLNEDGPEYRQVREAGWEIAEDGWQFEM